MLKPFAFGEPDSGTIYRKFFYNKNGQVVKKFSFDTSGAIEMKEAYEFNSNGNILTSQFISDRSILRERFVYDQNNVLQEYFFSNPRWDNEKKEVWTFDKQGRKVKKVSFGLLGTPEVITHFLYEGNQKKYKFRHVTDSEGKLIMTLLYTYDDRSNQTGLYSYLLTPENVNKLLKDSKRKGEDLERWEAESISRSLWNFDENNNAIGFSRDEQAQEFHLNFQGLDFSGEEKGRIITQKSSSEFEKIREKYYLVKTTEWWPRFNEPLKEVKEYIYFDKDGNSVYPVKDNE